MAVFNSDTFTINSPRKKIIDFVSIPKNLIDILPKDRVEDWEGNNESCSFKIKGLAHISLGVHEVSEDHVILISKSEKPFAFKLILTLHSNLENDNSSDLSAMFDADVNSFMGAMLKTPLTNFLNHLGEQLKLKYA